MKQRAEIRRNPSDVLITNYKMLDLLLQRADDLAEAIDEVPKHVHDTVGRMHWNGPHHDRVRTELATVTHATGTVATRLRERAQVLRQAADASKTGLERFPHDFLEGLLGPAGALLHDRYLR